MQVYLVLVLYISSNSSTHKSRSKLDQKRKHCKIEKERLVVVCRKINLYIFGTENNSWLSRFYVSVLQVKIMIWNALNYCFKRLISKARMYAIILVTHKKKTADRASFFCISAGCKPIRLGCANGASKPLHWHYNNTIFLIILNIHLQLKAKWKMKKRKVDLLELCEATHLWRWFVWCVRRLKQIVTMNINTDWIIVQKSRIMWWISKSYKPTFVCVVDLCMYLKPFYPRNKAMC